MNLLSLTVGVTALTMLGPGGGPASGMPSSHEPDRVVGLLALPEVFGDGPCHDFEPGELSLHPEPGADAVLATVRVDERWTFHERGGCGGLSVGVHDAATGEVVRLPTMEFGYEQPGAIVLERREGWFRIRHGEGSAWVRPSERAEFHSLAVLLIDALAYMTDAWDGPLAPEPGRGALAAELDRVGSDPTHWGRMSVEVDEVRSVGEELWVAVRVFSHSVCEGREEPRQVASGWLPAHAPSGELTVWFYSRGC